MASACEKVRAASAGLSQVLWMDSDDEAHLRYSELDRRFLIGISLHSARMRAFRRIASASAATDKASGAKDTQSTVFQP